MYSSTELYTKVMIKAVEMQAISTVFSTGMPFEEFLFVIGSALFFVCFYFFKSLFGHI